MSDDNSGPDKPTDETVESTDEETHPDAETTSSDPTSVSSIEADLGASALVELDTVDVEQGTVSTRTLTFDDDEPFGIELGLQVGPTRTEVVLDPEATAALAAEFDDAVATFEECGEL